MSSEVYDWNATITIKVKGKTIAEYEAFLEQVKASLALAKENNKIDYARIDVHQQFKDKTWEIPSVTGGS